jgi:hypothetical protein
MGKFVLDLGLTILLLLEVRNVLAYTQAIINRPIFVLLISYYMTRLCLSD